MACFSRARAMHIAVKSIVGGSLEDAPLLDAAQADPPPIRTSCSENVAMSALRFN